MPAASVVMLLCNAIGVPVCVGSLAANTPMLHVQPLVAVDDVVAGTARDHVAAVTTKDDVAGACKEVTPAPSTACRPAMSAMPAASSGCRVKPSVPPWPNGRRSAASVSAPVRTSLNLVPDRPSTDS